MRKMHEIKTVVTPIDFSDNAGLVVESAAYIAGTFGASLHVIFIVQNFEDYSGFFVPQMSVPNIEHELFVGAEEQMESFCKAHQSFFNKAGVGEVTSKVLVGDVGEKIVEYATEVEGDMIVMGTHGKGIVNQAFFGSVAKRVLRRVRKPVFIIPLPKE